MIRFLEHLAGGREIWGTDIDAGRIVWCKQNLSPPFRFITTTTVPHLPFEDPYFDFIYAGSVFTHIDDLADTWFAELRTVLRPGGKLFVTVHLRNDIALLNGKYRQSGLAKFLRGHAELRRVLRPGGKLFVTVHLRNDIALLNGKYRQSGLAKFLRGHPEYDQFTRSDFDMFTIGRSSESFVFYDIDYLRKSLEPLFRVLSITEEVRLYQNAVLLERA